MSKTMIEYANHVWNPITGCTKVSEGCRNCWAERFSKRLKIDFSEVTVHQDRIDNPKFPRRPSRIFVCSMSDLFHDDVSDIVLDMIFTVMTNYPVHKFMILTKRMDYAKYWFDTMYKNINLHKELKNIWLGVSVEDQKTADERIPILLQTPAAVRWVSAEPLLGEIKLINYDIENESTLSKPYLFSYVNGIDWLVTGGESGPKARPSHPDWFRSLRDQCAKAGVPFWFKQWGEWGPVHSMACNEPGVKGKLWHSFDPDTSVCRIGKKMIQDLHKNTLDGNTYNQLPADPVYSPF
jgi:protein gp37